MAVCSSLGCQSWYPGPVHEVMSWYRNHRLSPRQPIRFSERHLSPLYLQEIVSTEYLPTPTAVLLTGSDACKLDKPTWRAGTPRLPRIDRRLATTYLLLAFSSPGSVPRSFLPYRISIRYIFLTTGLFQYFPPQRPISQLYYVANQQVPYGTS
jgi:hypothetical protein